MTNKFDPKNLPSSVTKKLYVHYHFAGYRAGEFTIFDFKFEDEEKMVIAEQEVTIDIAEQENIQQRAAGVLKEKLKQVRAENYKREQVIQEKIDQLLAIEYQPQEAA